VLLTHTFSAIKQRLPTMLVNAVIQVSLFVQINTARMQLTVLLPLDLKISLTWIALLNFHMLSMGSLSILMD
jgi:hypothetical protein